MNQSKLLEIVQQIKSPGKGILAADESIPTIGKRFKAIDVPNEPENRQAYRSLLFTTPDLEKYVSGVILFEETFDQMNGHDQPLANTLTQKGILPGIKVDKGKVPFQEGPEEITQGLDDLDDRLNTFYEKGARFAKWRAVFKISDSTPSQALIEANAFLLARYAYLCQKHNMVPIVEPEVLIDGDHSIEQCANASERVLNGVFQALFKQEVFLEGIILKPSMVLPGKEASKKATPEEVAEHTLKVFKRTVPAAVQSIHFLSGGQTPEEATQNLNAMNKHPQPWTLSFSYGRALQEPCLLAWGGQESNLEKAQQALLKVAQQNSQASLGKG